MPCYTINLISVEFVASNLKVLEAAARVLNARYAKSGDYVYVGGVTIDMVAKKATSETQEQINILKRTYSKEAVKLAAKAKGWTLDAWKEKSGIQTTIAMKF